MTFIASIILKPLVLFAMLMVVRPVTKAINLNMRDGVLKRLLFLRWK